MKLAKMSAFTDLPQDSLVTYVANSATLMAADPQFVSLTAQVAELKTRNEAYRAALTESVNGGRLTTIVKNKCKVAVLEQMSNICLLVEMLANGDESVILAAGLDVRKTPTKVTSLDAPTVLKITNVPMPGIVTVQLAKVEGAMNYGIERRMLVPDTDPVWQNGDYSSSLKMELKGFELGKTYQIRFRAIGTKGLVSDWSTVQELLVS